MRQKQQIISTPVIVLVGPTAIGKTALSLRIAEQFHCEIISMDSMQVYRYMDVGTAKASLEERTQVPHYLIDICDPDEQYNAARFVNDALDAINDIAARGKVPLITGGTGLYLSSLLNGLFTDVPVQESVRLEVRKRYEEKGREAAYAELLQIDAVAAERIHINDTQRLLRGLEIFHSTGIPWSLHLESQQQQQPPISFQHLLVIGLTCERSRLYERIEKRAGIMMKTGLMEEVKKLQKMGFNDQLTSMQAIGYRHAVQYLNGSQPLEETIKELVRDTRRYAKRQMTWFQKQRQLQWYEQDNDAAVLADIQRMIQKAQR
ncbi:tRNA (adenosine(37)-N6)-dimethylallyltransferase MiaA [Desulfogranum marinum]|uniref:tRNA (adenosine(37)-N6)-dimethylallyltransferase MiaA n=1 Tax=Desulfogranum marinum TaxID=453220 RepID=UPI001962D0E2|nr:tRNA (adenosine(37)-N6)-dimethylallyltransferase MiaA [Desulfogranum marinum]MBM9511546.1 tRNA (adenosine(37)-N6)-dimethylallyltransferase MiaA [Desulfogranum marinum]